MSLALATNEWATSAAVVVLVALPWVLGGWAPDATAFIPSLLLAVAAGFTSTAALVMSLFDTTMRETTRVHGE